MSNIIKDIFNVAKNRLKMYTHSKSVMTAFIISSLAAGFIIMTFFNSAESKSTIPIGLVDEDKTQASKELVEELKKDNVLTVIDGSKDEVKEELIEGNVFSMFVIDKGFENNLNEGQTRRIITNYYLKENEKVKIISDIVLSKMLRKICFIYTYEAYDNHTLKDNKMSKEEFENVINEQYDSNDRLFAFDFEVVNTKSDTNVTDNITNGLIYKQIIIIITGILMAFIALFAANMIIIDKKYKTDIRLRISLASRLGIFLGNFLSLFVVTSIFGLISNGFILNKLGLSKEYYLTFVIFTLLYASVISMIFMVLCQWIKEPITLQFVGALCIFALSVGAVMKMFDFVIPKYLIKIVAKLPMSLLCDGYTDLIVNGKINSQIGGIFVNLVILLCLGIIKQLFKSEDKRYEL